jgi:hypothetical protein
MARLFFFFCVSTARAVRAAMVSPVGRWIDEFRLARGGEAARRAFRLFV